ncbi:MAG: hypothetical protein K2O31_00735 [Clostridia bacterium]|nr:hypothetical protein [Clostridia bacterium]
MKSKKVLICFLVAILVLSFVACGEEQHYHYFEEVSRTPATCTTAGEIVERCSCGEERTREILIDITKHNYAESLRTSATCTKDGRYEEECTWCNDRKIEFFSKLGHNYVEIETTATCTERGVRTMKCSRCSDMYDENVDALGHTYDSEGYCSMCERFMYDIQLSVELPATLHKRYSTGRIYRSIQITEVKFRIVKQYSYSTPYLYMVYSGKKTYDESGNTHTGSVDFVCILKDRETGEIITSKTEWGPL